MFSKLKKIKFFPLTIILILFIFAVCPLRPVFWPGGTGVSDTLDKFFWGDTLKMERSEAILSKTNEFVISKTVEKDKKGNIVKTIEINKYDNEKTLWDWLSLLGVPLSLAILGYFLQQQQQKRAEKLSEDQRKIADNETKEEVLQTYFDRLSVLLIDKNLIALSNKNVNEISSEEKELLNSALDVIRARTLSILRRFENDVERKTSVINFLIETEIVSKSGLKLSGANLEEANLEWANLDGASLKEANLKGANLKEAYLEEAKLQEANLARANLKGANLKEANLEEANLKGANLEGANLEGANLKGANLEGANLKGAKLEGANLKGAKLEGANLKGANLEGANLKGANLEGANLEGSYLKGANLEEAKHLTNSQIKTACYWEKAIHTETEWYFGKQSWAVKDEIANQNKINEIKQNKASDPKTLPDCSNWEDF